MTCQLCDRDTCRCLHRMRQQLATIATNYTHAEKQLMPAQGGDGRSNERPIGIRINALDFIAGNTILPQLEEWEKDWRSFFDLTPFGMASLQRSLDAARRHAESPNAYDPYPSTQRRLEGCIAFLTEWVDQALQQHPAITDFAIELRDLHQQSNTAANKQPTNAWWITCPATTDDGDCGNRLRAEGRDLDGTLHCRQCGTTWNVERLLRVAAADKQSEIWLTPDDAARLFGIPERTLRNWAKRGYIKRAHGQYEHHSIRNALTEGGTT